MVIGCNIIVPFDCTLKIHLYFYTAKSGKHRNALRRPQKGAVDNRRLLEWRGRQHYRIKLYNLDAILSVGYRVNSVNATAFRRWATSVLKQHLLRGYSINKQLMQISRQLSLDIAKHDAQYTPIPVKVLKKSHNRFLIIDDDVYHVGASIKDLGKKWTAIMKMESIDYYSVLSRI